MKRILVGILSLGMMFGVSLVAMADSSETAPYGWVNIGRGNNVDSVLFLAGIAGVQIEDSPFDHCGVEISWISANKTDTPYFMCEYPCPHYDYTIVSDNENLGTLGIDLLGFIKDFYLGAGIYTTEYRTISKSNVTGWHYLEYEDSDLEITLCVGYQKQFDGANIKIEYHTIKGANITFGIIF
jgi:hypothetical protein